ncbi:fibronectin-binding protein [Mycolicibacterium holsaticum]|uniref:fibronectin-binding protein n=1 Tax=Mycolicibacterium holsaticum TaxID=152142 RepID=UPI001041F69F|nr:fibronectin-binding protein [Mycolicibacterium holsaticum]
MALFAGGLFTAVPAAHADQPDDRCSPSESILCYFFPIAPNLEGDIDMTKDQPPVDPSLPDLPQASLAELCVNKCM